ncbi:MAG: S9 family peptidase [Methanobacteriota archaeon]|nr:MAG: S9 family peptidase [Euryarchaeota archaeon]
MCVFAFLSNEFNIPPLFGIPMVDHSQRGFWKGIPVESLINGSQYVYPKFSPTSNHLAFVGSTSEGKFLFLYDFEKLVQLSHEFPLSTGTAYGGGLYCWDYRGEKIYFSSKGSPYSVLRKGGRPKQLRTIDGAFHFAPVSDKKGVIWSLEYADHMELAVFTKDSIERIPCEDHFQYDASINSKTENIAFHAWSYPYMSWDRSHIHLWDGQDLSSLMDEEDVSVSQPRFSPDGNHLAFICDKSGWFNLWLAKPDGRDPRQLIDLKEEIAYPTWVTGNVNFVWTPDSKGLYFTRIHKGFYSIAYVDLDGNIEDLPLPKGEYSQLTISPDGRFLAYLFSDYRTPGNVEIYDLQEKRKAMVFQGGTPMERYDFAAPVSFEFPTNDGMTAHALAYFIPDADGRIHDAPTLFLIHGGPTGMSRNKFDATVQYFASRGWLVVAVNHRGSAGYGREYRQMLNGHWGIYDVEDTVDCKRYLVQQEMANPNKCAIMGGSAGGYTTLLTLIRYKQAMKAGVNLFGVTDLFTLANETHFLEAQYDTMLVGGLPECASTYYERSPIFHAAEIEAPLLVLQGGKDPVVIPSQSERLVKKVKGTIEYKLYEDEGHGFSKKETLLDMYPRIDKFLTSHVLYGIP